MRIHSKHSGFDHPRASEITPRAKYEQRRALFHAFLPNHADDLDGTELDFVREGLNEGFRFNNPRERDRCGCGESFRV